uniref:Orofacial cleft 1 candidate gene 1 protein n=1 Tax=Poecilia mexicana TaxID=48701 RepID=A0A3B3Y6J9_9TELE
IHLTISLQKLQQKALQQPKQKKSKSAEFLMGSEERAAVVGIENPAFNGEGSAALSNSPSWLGRKMRGDRPDSTLAAHQKKLELQAPASERGNERVRNYFDPPPPEQTDPRQCEMAGVSAEDELELKILKADENRLYERMTALLNEDETFINIPGTLQASRDEEVLEVKAGDLVLQRRLLLNSGGGGGGDASGPRPSQAHTIAKPQAESSAWLGGEAGLQAGRMVTGRESAVKTRAAEEVIPCYAQQLRERVRPDMITLGSLSLQQVSATKGEYLCHHPIFTSTSEPSSQRACDEVLRPQPRGDQGALPQSIEVCVCCLRAARDKLPRGLYSVRVALQSPLGGPSLHLRSSKEQTWPASTEPVEHRGRFYDIDLHINQSLFMSLPAASEINPSIVLLFQLISLPEHSSHFSSVLAWGVFPVCSMSLSLVQGRFKTPLIRGEPSPQLDQFKKIEAIISSDLDHWLCNLYFQVKKIPLGTSGGTELFVAPSRSLSNPKILSKPEDHQDLTLTQRPTSQSQICPHPLLLQSQQHLYVGPGCRAGESAVLLSQHGSPQHLSADSAGSSSSLPGRKVFSGSAVEKTDPCREKAEVGFQYKKKPIKKTNSCGPSMSGRSAPPLQADKHKMQPTVENLSMEEMEGYTFFLQSSPTTPSSCPPRLSDRARLALRLLPSELGLLPLSWQQQQPRRRWHDSVRQLGLIILLLALMWFVRLYLHYCSQWLYLQAIAVPVNKFHFHAHTVDLVYQSSLLHTREELAMVVVGPLTLNAVTFLLVLIRWGCQLIFGSLPSFTSNFIMAQGVWTVLDPLAVFAVDAVLGRLAYSPDTPVGDAAKLYWHFYRADGSGAAGVIITLFLYAVHFLLSITILTIYLLRFHNDGRMLDVYQRLTAKEGMYFLPEDLELSNQELSFIVKKAEQWRGFNGERRKVAVYDSIWTAEDSLSSPAAPGDEPHTVDGLPPESETSTHVVIQTLYLSVLKQRYRHFLRQPDGAIIEVIGELHGLDNSTKEVPSCLDQSSSCQREDKASASISLQLRKRKKLFGRSNRVEPIAGSGCGSSFARLPDLTQ